MRLASLMMLLLEGSKGIAANISSNAPPLTTLSPVSAAAAAMAAPAAATEAGLPRGLPRGLGVGLGL